MICSTCETTCVSINRIGQALDRIHSGDIVDDGEDIAFIFENRSIPLIVKGVFSWMSHQYKLSCIMLLVFWSNFRIKERFVTVCCVGLIPPCFGGSGVAIMYGGLLAVLIAIPINDTASNGLSRAESPDIGGCGLGS